MSSPFAGAYYYHRQPCRRPEKNGGVSPTVRSLLRLQPSSTAPPSVRRRTRGDQHTLRLRLAWRRQGSRDPQPLPPSSRVRVLPAQVHWTRRPGSVTSSRFTQKIPILREKDVNFMILLSMSLKLLKVSLFFVPGCCVCNVLESSFRYGCNEWAKCELYFGLIWVGVVFNTLSCEVSMCL